jgi:hypothetical protein
MLDFANLIPSVPSLLLLGLYLMILVPLMKYLGNKFIPGTGITQLINTI